MDIGNRTAVDGAAAGAAEGAEGAAVHIGLYAALHIGHMGACGGGVGAVHTAAVSAAVDGATDHHGVGAVSRGGQGADVGGHADSAEAAAQIDLVGALEGGALAGVLVAQNVYDLAGGAGNALLAQVEVAPGDFKGTAGKVVGQGALDHAAGEDTGMEVGILGGDIFIGAGVDGAAADVVGQVAGDLAVFTHTHPDAGLNAVHKELHAQLAAGDVVYHIAVDGHIVTACKPDTMAAIGFAVHCGYDHLAAGDIVGQVAVQGNMAAQTAELSAGHAAGGKGVGHIGVDGNVPAGADPLIHTAAGNSYIQRRAVNLGFCTGAAVGAVESANSTALDLHSGAAHPHGAVAAVYSAYISAFADGYLAVHFGNFVHTATVILAAPDVVGTHSGNPLKVGVVAVLEGDRAIQGQIDAVQRIKAAGAVVVGVDAPLPAALGGFAIVGDGHIVEADAAACGIELIAYIAGFGIGQGMDINVLEIQIVNNIHGCVAIVNTLVVGDDLGLVGAVVVVGGDGNGHMILVGSG